MKLQKRLAALLIAACLTLATAVTAYAHEAVDVSRTGSITVTMKYNGSAVSGGKLALYQVGEIDEDDGDYSFALTDEFEGSGVELDLENMDKSILADLAAELAEYAAEEGLSGKSVTVGSNGVATATGLKLGLYLVVQTQAASGYHAVSPFLVSVPMNEDGVYVYDVDATPKMGVLTEKEPSKPSKPSKPTKPATPPKKTLPQTGQLNWPVPVMTGFGLCLLLLGVTLRSGRKETPHET